jgi:hypothetical protein
MGDDDAAADLPSDPHAGARGLPPEANLRRAVSRLSLDVLKSAGIAWSSSGLLRGIQC